MKQAIIAAAAMAFAVTAAPAQEADHLINQPKAGWFVLGAAQSNKVVADPTAKGGKAIEVSVSGDGPPFAAGAIQRITGAYKRGDRIVVAGYVRATSQRTTPVALLLRVEGSTAPWTTIAQKSVAVGSEWTLQTLEFTATEDRAAGTAQVNIQMNTGAQTVFLGPLVVLDEGSAQ